MSDVVLNQVALKLFQLQNKTTEVVHKQTARHWLETFITYGKDDLANGIEFVYQEGGEGEGEHAEAVFKINDDTYKATWSYFSHYGADYDYLEVDEVKPVKKMVTVYE